MRFGHVDEHGEAWLTNEPCTACGSTWHVRYHSGKGRALCEACVRPPTN